MGAATRLLYFLMAYGVVILGFALVIYLQLGARFIQFSTWYRAFQELFLLTCGSPATVFADLYPAQDWSSMNAYMYISAYLIVMVIIGLQFFTSILLDAYNIALD